ISGNRPADLTPPAVPANLAAVGSTSGIALDWSDNVEPDLAGYNVYGQNTGGQFVKLNTTPLTSSAYNDATAAFDSTTASPVALTAGQKVDIKIEYFENTGSAFVQLYWQTSTMAKTLVPMTALYPPGA